MIAAEISFQLITCCSGPAQEHTQKQGTVAVIFAQWPNSIITTFSYHVTNAGAKSLFPPRDNNTGHWNSSCCKMVNKSLSVLQTSGNDLFYYLKKPNTLIHS